MAGYASQKCKDVSQLLRDWLPTNHRSSDVKPAELFDTHPLSAMMLNSENESMKSDNLVLIVNSWRSDWHKNGVQVPVQSSVDLPRPIYDKVDLFNTNPHHPFELRPEKLWHDAIDLRFNETTHCVLEQPLRFYPIYQIDDLDCAWISIVNAERECLGQVIIREWMLENVFEALEQLTFVKMRESIKELEVQSLEYDESAKCDICLSYEGEDDNELVFCDGCFLCVHQACYGIKSLPEGSWVCRQCEAGVKSTTPCSLCPNTGGAMKMADDGTRWCHVSCALWVPEVGFGDVDLMEPVTRLDNIPQARRNLVCSICRSRFGAPIQCSNKKCKIAFHVTCAFQSNLTMRQELEDKDVRMVGLCPKHTRKDHHQSRQQTQSPTKTTVTSLQTGGAPVSHVSESSTPATRRQKLLDLENYFHSLVSPKEVDQWLSENQRNGLQRRSTRQSTSATTTNSKPPSRICPIPSDIQTTISAYWRLKRRSNFNQPLINPVPLDWHQKANAVAETTKEALAQAARVTADQRAAEVFRLVRFGLDRARLVVDMVLQRERRKLALFKRMWRTAELQIQWVAETGCSSKRLTPEEVTFFKTAHVGESIYDNGMIFAARRGLTRPVSCEPLKQLSSKNKGDRKRSKEYPVVCKQLPISVSPGAENYVDTSCVVQKFSVNCIPKNQLIVTEDIKHRLRSALNVMVNFDVNLPQKEPLNKQQPVVAHCSDLYQKQINFLVSSPPAPTTINQKQLEDYQTMVVPIKRPRRGTSSGLSEVGSFIDDGPLPILSKIAALR